MDSSTAALFADLRLKFSPVSDYAWRHHFLILAHVCYHTVLELCALSQRFYLQCTTAHTSMFHRTIAGIWN